MTKGTQVVVSRQNVYDAFEYLYNQLSAGYWAATTIEAKDRIRGLSDAIFEILTALNRSDIETRDADFKELTETVKRIAPRLEKLEKEIDQIIHAVKIAENVAQAVDKAIDLAAKYFKI